MKLLMLKHHSLCFRVRMVTALKELHPIEQVVEDDDGTVLTDFLERSVIPIWVLDHGQPILKSWDIADHIDGIGALVLTRPQHPVIADFAVRVLKVTPFLMNP